MHEIIITKFLPLSRFHGSGTLFFPNGGCLEATWNRGQATGPGVGGKYIFKDQLEYGEDMWEYCTLKDRRFYSEICNGIKPAGMHANTISICIVNSTKTQEIV